MIPYKIRNFLLLKKCVKTVLYVTEWQIWTRDYSIQLFCDIDKFRFLNIFVFQFFK